MVLKRGCEGHDWRGEEGALETSFRFPQPVFGKSLLNDWTEIKMHRFIPGVAISSPD